MERGVATFSASGLGGLDVLAAERDWKGESDQVSFYHSIFTLPSGGTYFFVRKYWRGQEPLSEHDIDNFGPRSGMVVDIYVWTMRHIVQTPLGAASGQPTLLLWADRYD